MTKKTCFIIGASHGIGEALAIKYFNSGYNVVLSARSVDKLEKIKEQLEKKSQDQKVLITHLDVEDVNSLQKSSAEVLEKFSKIDLVIFCPALYQPMLAMDFDLEIAKKIININLIGCLNFLHVILPIMQKEKSGHIAIIASVAGYAGLPRSFAYGASKAALINLCEGIYPELQKENIDLSIINPGFVATRLTDKNNFKMPFIISPEKAADIIFAGLAAKKFEIHFPKKFTILLKILRFLPYKLFFTLTKKAL
jgi:short-subunit dehydrogenase